MLLRPVLLITSSLLLTGAAHAADAAPDFEGLREAVHDLVDGQRLAGAVMLASQNGERVFSDVYGQRRLEEPEPATDDTIFLLASMTKPVVGVARNDGECHRHFGHLAEREQPHQRRRDAHRIVVTPPERCGCPALMPGVELSGKVVPVRHAVPMSRRPRTSRRRVAPLFRRQYNRFRRKAGSASMPRLWHPREPSVKA